MSSFIFFIICIINLSILFDPFVYSGYLFEINTADINFFEINTDLYEIKSNVQYPKIALATYILLFLSLFNRCMKKKIFINEQNTDIIESVYKKKQIRRKINYMLKTINYYLVMIYLELRYYKNKLKEKKQIFSKSRKFTLKENYTNKRNKFYYKNLLLKDLPLKIEDLYSVYFKNYEEFHEAIKQNFRISGNWF